MKYAIDECLLVSESRRLEPHHATEWRESGVNETIIRNNVSSINTTEVLKYLLNYKPDQKWKHPSSIVPGWFVSGVNPKTGEPNEYGQYKPDTPLITDGKTQKYLNPGGEDADPLFLDTGDQDYWPQVMKDKLCPILITEGAKKAGAALSRGVASISVPGVWNIQKKGRLNKFIKPFCQMGRSFFLAYDADLWEKPTVFKALTRAGRLLTGSGGIVYIIRWPSMHKGLDEWLASGGDLAAAMEAAPTLEEFLAELNPEDVPEDCKLKQSFSRMAGLLADRVVFNELTHQIEIDGEPVQPEMLRLNLALNFNIDIRQKDAEMIALYLGKRNSYHPIRDYLESCPTEDPSLLDQIAPKILGIEDALSVAFIRKFLISAVARVMRPGCPVHTVLILQGAQGAGKSSFFRLLCPESDWFDDSFGNQTDKDERLKLHESWICEWGELESVFKRREISALKSFITCQTDKIRPPYAAKAESFHRPSVLVGSTNQDEFLADATGNRRFNVVRVPGAIDLEKLMAWRDRIWGAALAAFNQGEAWKIPENLYQQQSERANEFTLGDTWESQIETWLAENPIPSSGLTSQFALETILGIPVGQQDKGLQMRLADALKRLGFTNERGWVEVVPGEKQRRRVWIKKENEKLDVQAVQVDQTEIEGGGQQKGQQTGQLDIVPPSGENWTTGQPGQLDRTLFKTFSPENAQLSPGDRVQYTPPQNLPTDIDWDDPDAVNKTLTAWDYPIGSKVVPTAETRLYPKHSSVKLPKFLYQKAKANGGAIKFTDLPDALFLALTEPATVMAISKDGDRLMVQAKSGDLVLSTSGLIKWE